MMLWLRSCRLLLQYMRQLHHLIPIDFLLDLVLRIGHQNGSLCVTRRHLSPLSLDSWEERRIYTCRLHVFELRGNVSCHSKIRVLINGCGNEAWNICSVTVDMGEGIGECGDGLDGWVRVLSDVVRF